MLRIADCLPKVNSGGKVWPSFENIIELLVDNIIGIKLTIAISSVEPIVLVVGIHLQGSGEIDYGTVIFLLTKTRHGT